MSLDRDLHDALAPLAGDPVADAARVLAALPPIGPGGARPRGGPRFPWWWLAAALTAGLAVGFALAHLGGTPPAAPPSPQQPPAKKESDPGKGVVSPPNPMDPMWEALYVMAFGDIEADEPGHDVQVLRPGEWRVDLDSGFATGDGMAGIYVGGTDARIRLDAATRAKVGLDAIELSTGRLWLSTVERPHAVRIDAGVVVVQGEAMELVVDRAGDGASIAVLDGGLSLRTRQGETMKLEAGRRVRVDARRGLGAAEAIGFAGSLTGWMAPMILQQQDETELRLRLDAMTRAWIDGAHRDEAARELRRLGSRAVPPLFLALDKVIGDPELLHATAALIGDLADYGKAQWLFAMLERGDEQTRAIAFRALVRAVATAIEDEAFWRRAEPEARAAAIGRWRALVR